MRSCYAAISSCQTSLLPAQSIVMIKIQFIALTLLFLASTMSATHARAEEKSLEDWLSAFKQEAVQQGIDRKLVDRALAGFTPDERIIRLDRKQPEGTLSFTKYRRNVLPDSRIRKGQALYKKHKTLLDKIGNEYGVQPRFIVALWGIETSYGKVTGSFNVPLALATLAYDGRRSDFFRKELLNALQIIQDGHITAHQMKGSWAGAMGQSQFMPSSFLNFAVDYNKDGRRDIWHTKEDIFASVANYLKQSGWNDDLTWGREVQLPQEFDDSLAVIDAFRPLGKWAAMGISRTDGSALPVREIDAALMFPGKPDEGAYIIYRNYPVILKWNRSRYFATAVGLLSDRIGEACP